MFKITIIITIAVFIIGAIIIIIKSPDVDCIKLFIFILICFCLLGSWFGNGAIRYYISNSSYWEQNVNTSESQLSFEKSNAFLKQENDNYILEFKNGVYYFYNDENCNFQDSCRVQGSSFKFDNYTILFKESTEFKITVEKTKTIENTSYHLTKDFPFLFASDEKEINDIKAEKDKEKEIDKTVVTFYIPENTLVKEKDANGVYIYRKPISKNGFTIVKTEDERMKR